MNSESIVNQCPHCGGAIPGDAPQGLCPRCVLAGASLPTEAGRQPSERLVAPPLEAVTAAFPDLEIVELIGVGGMGVVYKVRQPKLDRYAALKLLPQSLSADPAFAERFHREARFLARLNHPNIVTVFDFGQSGGFCYLLLEFVDGVNLRQAMRAGRFSPSEALAIVPHICGALQYAHDQGVLHRDIKPENILLDGRGRVKLADFGIAKLVTEPGGARGDITLTQSGARLGTAHYMAPEQIEKPSEVDHRADIYSLGVVFYELLTGELPIGRFAAPSEKADMDSRVDAIVFRALAKERELRQQSAGEVRTQVETVTSHPQAAEAAPGGSFAQSKPAAGIKQASGPLAGEYKSKRTLLGLPLLHIAYGRDPNTGELRKARGIIAIGSRASGVLAFGTYARGLVAFGGIAVGGLAFGGIGIGVLSIAGLALGLVTFGGLSIGLLLAVGGLAVGVLNAAGGLAVGKFSAGGIAAGRHVWDATRHDPGAHGLYQLVNAPWLSLFATLAAILSALIPALVTSWSQRLLCRFSNPDGSEVPPLSSSRRRLKWFGIAMIVLPIAAFLNFVIVGRLARAGLPLVGVFRGALPMLAGACLGWAYMKGRPQAPPQRDGGRKFNLFQVVFVTLLGILLVVALVLFIIIGLRVVLPSAPTATTTPAELAGNDTAQLFQTDFALGDPVTRVNWELESPVPGSIRLSLGHSQIAYPLAPAPLAGRWHIPITVLFERSKAGMMVYIHAGDQPLGQNLRAAVPGDPAQLLKKAGELLSGDLSLKFNTPVWIAFAGLEQVRLEITRDIVPDPTDTPVTIDYGGLPEGLPIGTTNVAAIQWHAAWEKLGLLQKRADAGEIAPQGREMFEAEREVAAAESEYLMDPSVAAAADVEYANRILDMTKKRYDLGQATKAELTAAMRAQKKAETRFERYLPQISDEAPPRP